MENIEGLTNDEIKELILEQLKDAGLDTSSIEIEVEKGPSIVLKGTVESSGERYIVRKTIMDIDGIEDISDELVVMEEPEGPDSEDDGMEGGLLNRDGDDTMTEDAFEAIEDGIPYIPPDRPLRDEMSDDTSWKKNRKKKK